MKTTIVMTNPGGDWTPADHALQDALLAAGATEDVYDQEPDGECVTFYQIHGEIPSRLRAMVEAADHADYGTHPQEVQR